MAGPKPVNTAYARAGDDNHRKQDLYPERCAPRVKVFLFLPWLSKGKPEVATMLFSIHFHDHITPNGKGLSDLFLPPHRALFATPLTTTEQVYTYTDDTSSQRPEP